MEGAQINEEHSNVSELKMRHDSDQTQIKQLLLSYRIGSSTPFTSSSRARVGKVLCNHSLRSIASIFWAQTRRILSWGKSRIWSIRNSLLWLTLWCNLCWRKSESASSNSFKLAKRPRATRVSGRSSSRFFWSTILTSSRRSWSSETTTLSGRPLVCCFKMKRKNSRSIWMPVVLLRLVDGRRRTASPAATARRTRPSRWPWSSRNSRLRMIRCALKANMAKTHSFRQWARQMASN